jgi:hypothetical protein
MTSSWREKTKDGFQLFHSVNESWQGGYSLHYCEEDEHAALMLANGGFLPKLYYLCMLNHTPEEVAICKAEINKWFTPMAVARAANCCWNPTKHCVENCADTTLNDIEEDDLLVKCYHITLDLEARKWLGVVNLAVAGPAAGGKSTTVQTESTVHTMRELKGTKNHQVNNDFDSISTYGPQSKNRRYRSLTALSLRGVMKILPMPTATWMCQSGMTMMDTMRRMTSSW